MSRSCVHSRRCAFVMTIVMFMTMFMVIMMTIVSANQPPNTRLHRLRHGRSESSCAPGVSGWGFRSHEQHFWRSQWNV